jgi:hypothetical protein
MKARCALPNYAHELLGGFVVLLLSLTMCALLAYNANGFESLWNAAKLCMGIAITSLGYMLYALARFALASRQQG